VQILTIEDVVLNILKDPVLCKQYPDVLGKRMDSLIKTPSSELFYKIAYL